MLFYKQLYTAKPDLSNIFLALKLIKKIAVL